MHHNATGLQDWLLFLPTSHFYNIQAVSCVGKPESFTHDLESEGQAARSIELIPGMVLIYRLLSGYLLGVHLFQLFVHKKVVIVTS